MSADDWQTSLQALTYEALAPYGPVWAALGAGFAVYIGTQLHLTPAGERYLERKP